MLVDAAETVVRSGGRDTGRLKELSHVLLTTRVTQTRERREREQENVNLRQAETCTHTIVSAG